MTKSEGVHLFSNGFEWGRWQAKNCSRCIKEPTCDLYDAIFSDSELSDLPSGSVKPETAVRLGYVPEYAGMLGWPCAERQTQIDPPAPATREMTKAGADMLPGFETVPTADRGGKEPWTA